MEIVKMDQYHTGQVADLERLCFSYPWSINSINYELTNPLSLWLVALDGETVAGYVGSQSVLGESDMMNLAVAPEYRRSGLGEQLVKELVNRLRETGNHCLTLEVRASNEPAISLYLKNGFAQVGRRPNYYRNPKEDALILRKEWEV